MFSKEETAEIIAGLSAEKSDIQKEVEARTAAEAEAGAAERNTWSSGANPPNISRWQSARRGGATGAGAIFDTLALGGSGVTAALDLIRPRIGAAPLPEMEPAPGFGDRFAEATGIPKSSDRLGQDIERFSGGVVQSIPFAPVAAAGAPALGLNPSTVAGLELLAGGFGPVVSEPLNESGHPALAIMAGTLVGGASGGVSAGGSAARKAATRQVDKFRYMTPEAAAAGRQFGLSRGAMVRGSSEIKRDIPDVAAAINELRMRMNQGRSAGLPHNPSSRQIVENMQYGRGGRALTEGEMMLTKTDRDYRRESARRYADNAEHLANRWDELTPVEPNFGTFIDDYDDVRHVREGNERTAWERFREGDRPQFNTADLVSMADKIVGNAYFKARHVPNAIRLLAKGRMTRMSIDRFQELRSELLGVVRDARKEGTEAAKHGAKMAIDMLEIMHTKMDDFARSDITGKPAEWAEARRLTLENNVFYDPDSPIIRALDQGGSPKNLFTKMREARGRRGKRTNPVEEARRLRSIAEQTPGGMENLRALAAEDLFADGFNPTAIRQPEKVLRRNEAMYRVIFDDDYDRMRELLDLTRLSTLGNPGTAAESYRTGSNQSPAAFILGLAKAARDPAGAAVEGVLKRTGMANAKDLEWQKLWRLAIERPEFLTTLLEMPTPRAVPEWEANWRRLLAASSAREAAKATARNATRSEREPR